MSIGSPAAKDAHRQSRCSACLHAPLDHGIGAGARRLAAIWQSVHEGGGDADGDFNDI